MSDSNTQVTLVDAPRPEPPPFAVRVFIYRAGCFCGTEVFTQPEIFIGRHPGSDLQLSCELVSGAHAMAQVCEDGLRIEDSGSKNGLRINGRKQYEAWLDDWDEVSLGTFVLRFELLGPWRRQDRRPALRAALWWNPEAEDTCEDVTVHVPEPRHSGLFPLADLLEPEETDAELLSRWAKRYGRDRALPIREIA
jgi:hypothetical protein